MINNCVKKVAVVGTHVAVEVREEIDPKWPADTQQRHREQNEKEILAKTLLHLWPEVDAPRRRCVCPRCKVHDMPMWGPYTRGRALPCLPGIRVMGHLSLHGCGAPTGFECRPGCPYIAQCAAEWNRFHGVNGVVCTVCGVEVHHPPRAGCDGDQHRKHTRSSCACCGNFGQTICAVCDATLRNPYVGSGHPPPAADLRVHTKTCAFRVFWEKVRRESAQ